MRRPTARRTVCLIVVVLIAASQTISWPAIQARMAFAPDPSFCHVERCGCCGCDGTDAVAIWQTARSGEDLPIADECDCRNCFCKVVLSLTFLTSVHGCAVCLPDFRYSGEPHLDYPLSDFSQNLFHPPRV